MIIAKNDEARRSRVWTITMMISSALIVVIAMYFLTKFFTVNPLEGSWENEDDNLIMHVNADGKIRIDFSGGLVMSSLNENIEASVEMAYVLDRDAKTITIKEIPGTFEEAAQKADETYTAEMLKTQFSELMTTFDYSVEKEQLTLTEREYGEQLTFIKK